MRLLLCALLCPVLALTGCRDTERLTVAAGEGIGQTGYRGAVYPIVIGNQVLGEATVAAEEIVDGEDEAPGSIARFELDIQNDAAVPLWLGPEDLRLQVKSEDGWVRENLAPIDLPERLEIAPGERVTLELAFLVPQIDDPDRVEAARLGWMVHAQEGSYEQATAFLEYQTSPGTYYYSPFYHPYGPGLHHRFHHRSGIHLRGGYYHHVL
jgi:hypothetical protein